MNEYLDIIKDNIEVDINDFWTEILAKADINRLISPFQLFDFRTKLFQFYTTSIGVKLGNVLEKIVKLYLEKHGAIFFDRKEAVEGHDCDQIFSYKDKIVLIEQKIRDDHDSSKKQGQVENYEYKRTVLKTKYSNVFCVFWFVDNSFAKIKIII